MVRLIPMLLFFAFVWADEAQILYASKVKSLYKEGETKVVGRLLPTAKVEVMERRDGRVLLRIQGYAPKEQRQALYFAPNRRILNAGFSKNAGLVFEVLQTINDNESRSDWELASIALWSEDADLVAEVAPLYAEANELFTSRCSICHALHPAKEFNANQWGSVIKSMKSRVGFDSDTEQLVVQYLSKNAKDMPKESK